MITCPHCGRQSEDAVTECPQCGTALARLSARPLPADSDRTVLLKAFPTEIEAQAAGQALLAAGVPYLIAADNCGGAFPGLEIYRGIQVRVQLRDLERAREILADFEAEKPEVDAETAEQGGATPSASAVLVLSREAVGGHASAVSIQKKTADARRYHDIRGSSALGSASLWNDGSEAAPAFGVRVLEAPLSYRRDRPGLAPRQPTPRSQSAGETGRTPHAGAGNLPGRLSAFTRSPRSSVMKLNQRPWLE